MTLLLCLAAAAVQGAGPPPAMPATGAPVAAPISAASPGRLLAAGTEIDMVVLDRLNSRTVRQGQRFATEVTRAVIVDGLEVIPRGARGAGEIARVVSRGAFGKPGKLEVRILYVELAGARIRLTGSTTDRGKANTGAAIAGAVVIGIIGGLVKGEDAEVLPGTPVTAYVANDVRLALRRGR